MSEVSSESRVTKPFCGDCARMRLSAEGKLYTCFFASEGNDLKTHLRTGVSDESIKELIDYEAFCGITRETKTDGRDLEYEISIEALKERLDRGDDIFILDVREPHEYEIVSMGGYLIPLADLPSRVHELDSSREIVTHCRHGPRSQRAVDFLRQLGFKKVKTLVGGIDAWAVRIDPTLPRY